MSRAIVLAATAITLMAGAPAATTTHAQAKVIELGGCGRGP